MEKNCKWHFGDEGGIDIGPNDPIHQTFKVNKYYSIVREAIQNSLDAVNDDRSPVTVSFQYFDLDRQQFPEFFKLEEHIRQSAKYYVGNHDAELLFGDMLHYLSGEQETKITCLRISDFNTKGMKYAEGNTQSPFYAFLRAAGVSAKQIGGSGGSFGFGKGAYFALSPLKTIIVSSKDNDENVYFEGTTRLTTHKTEDGRKLTAYGFYDNNNANPVTEENMVPDIFKREEVGTDINIMGLWDVADRDGVMIRSVLNNFWLAIHDNKLIVSFGHVQINRDNLEQTIDTYFSNEYENGNAMDIESWNPKPYYKAVKYANVSEQFKFFSDELPTLGTVKLFVYLEQNLQNRTAYFRRPRMVVFKRTNNRIKGYVAVFVCESEKGNDILRLLENPAHSEWKKENHPTRGGKIPKEARKAEDEFSDYVNHKLDSLSKINTSSKVTFLGLEEYLTIPEDLLEKDDDYDMSGGNSSIRSGNLSNDPSEEETGMQTTNHESVTFRPTIKPKTEIKNQENFELEDDGEKYVTSGGENNGGGGDAPSPSDGSQWQRGTKTDKQTNSRTLVSAKLKVAAQKENGIIYHTLIITPNKPIMNGEIELFAGSDAGGEHEIAIGSSDLGEIDGSLLKGIQLSAGRNLVKVCLADNLKHSLKVRTYEIQ